jgi:predicted RNase H-like nuclease (RuvC/YqgF family)
MKKKDPKKIIASAKSKVAEILSSEDLANQKEKLNDLFLAAETELSELKDAEEAAVENNSKMAKSIDDLKAKNSDLESTVSSLTEEKKTLEAKLDEAVKQIEALVEKISDMEKETAAMKRVKELKDADLFVNDKQIARVKNMDDEEFADFKALLVDLRKSWEEKNTSTATDTSKPAAGDKEEGKPKESDSGDTSDSEDEESITKTDIASILKFKKELAGLNMTSKVVEPDDKMKAEYASMWEEEEGE